MAGAKLLSYHDVVLRNGDAELLRDEHAWLNDQLIAFQFEYLSRENFIRHQKLLLVPGATTYLLINAGPEISEIVLAPLHFRRKLLSLFAINNNPDVTQAEGGSHWSLGCYYNVDNTFFHLDSCSGLNAAAAGRLFTALRRMLPPETRYIEAECPQQTNGYDCGMMVLAFANILCSRLATLVDDDDASRALPLASQELDFRIEQNLVSSEVLREMRREMHSLIMMKKQEQAN